MQEPKGVLASQPFPRGAPPCDQAAAHSPYRLEQSSSTPIPGGGNTVCFRVALVPCDAAQQCCASQDLFKAELDVDPSCQGSLTHVTVDGEEHPYEFSPALSLVRVVGIHRDAASAAGTQVCLSLQGRCTTLAALCASEAGQCRYALFNGGKRDCCPVGVAAASATAPAALPARAAVDVQAAASAAAVVSATSFSSSTSLSDFPYAQCQRDAAQSRYSLSDATLTPVADSEDTLTRACFKIDAGRACSGGCCDFDLHKLELDVSPACYGALAYVSVGGMMRPPFYQSGANPTIKVMNLPAAATAGGTEVCLYLRSQCSTLPQLCRRGDGRCAYSIFSRPGGSGEQCCPVGLAGTAASGAAAGSV